MLACRLARLRAGCLDCRINHFRVALRGNFLLSNGDHITDGAMLTLGLAGLGAGRCNCRINDLGVALGGDYFLRNEDFVTDGAVLALGQAGFGTGRLDGRVSDFGVAGGSDCFGLGCIANCAGVGLGTGVLTGRRGRDLALIPAVALGLNGFTLGDFFVADGADCITGVAVLGAGGILLVDHLGERMVVRPVGLEGQIGKSKQF